MNVGNPKIQMRIFGYLCLAIFFIFFPGKYLSAVEVKMNNFSEIGSREPRYLFKAKEIIDGRTFLLSDGRKVRLLGVQPINEKKSREFLKNLIADHPIIIEIDKLHNATLYRDDTGYYLVYAYVWGVTSLPPDMPSSVGEFVGFLNVKKGRFFSSPQKGVGLFLNAVLLKSGQATIDNAYEFTYKKEFEKWQRAADPHPKNKNGVES